MKVKELAAIAAIADSWIYDGVSKELRVKAYKANRALANAVEEFQKEEKAAKEKFKPKGYDELYQKIALRQPMTTAEAVEFTRLSTQYEEDIAEAVKELGEVEAELTFEKLTEDEFFELQGANPKITSGGWRMLESVIVKG